MTINQLSVFLENKSGQLLELCKVLAENNINMRAMSVADTSDFGIARIIVDNAQEAETILHRKQYVVTITPVLLIEIPDKSGSLTNIFNILAKYNCNLEYMYAFAGKKTNSAYMIMRATNSAVAENILTSNGIHLASAKDLADL